MYTDTHPELFIHPGEMEGLLLGICSRRVPRPECDHICRYLQQRAAPGTTIAQSWLRSCLSAR